METPKFKSVKFKPFDLWMSLYEYAGKWYWENACAINDATEYLRFHESTIEQYPELFEVEKAEREFEEGALYKAKFVKGSLDEVVKYMYSGFYRISSGTKYAKNEFYEIGEKIEL